MIYRRAERLWTNLEAKTNQRAKLFGQRDRFALSFVQDFRQTLHG